MARTTILVLAAALAGCGGSFPERLTYARIESAAVHGEMTYGVYVPPGFSAEERLPLVVFLHGGGDDAFSFDRHGVSGALDAAIASGEVPRVVIVVPQGDLGFWANWYDGSSRYQDWVLEEVVPRVARAYHTRPCPEGCHVMGASMGGAGSLRFALNRPAMWASATLISAPILSTEQMVAFVRNPLFVPLLPTDRIWGPVDDLDRIRRDDPYLRWSTPDALGGTRLLLAWGDHDRGAIRESGAAFAAHLEERGVPFDSIEYVGDHSWRSWTPVILEALRRQVRPHPQVARDDGSRVQ
ncbi:MAG: hypothetical protein KC619_18200 [Myxococcales bacterium]|nr:hypothetical protein [Myxococcales bacterium]